MKTPNKSSKYYSYKTFKKLGVPAIAYSAVSNTVGKLLRLQPRTIESTITTSTITTDEQNKPNKNKIAIVTGSNTGVGYETSKSLVVDHGYNVIIACRNVDKGLKACESINKEAAVAKEASSNEAVGGKAIFLQPLDLSDLDNVCEFVKVVNDKYDTIDVLINNAGRNSAGDPTTTTTSSTGNHQNNNKLDLIFTTNFLGHFLLTNQLLEKCNRVVNLSSVMHHFPKYSKQDNDDITSVDFWKYMAIDDSNGLEEKGETDTKVPATTRKTYAASKLAALIFSMELDRRYDNVKSIAVNPGSV